MTKVFTRGKPDTLFQRLIELETGQEGREWEFTRSALKTLVNFLTFMRRITRSLFIYLFSFSKVGINPIIISKTVVLLHSYMSHECF